MTDCQSSNKTIESLNIAGHLHGQDRDIFSVDFNANGFTVIEQDASDISGKWGTICSFRQSVIFRIVRVQSDGMGTLLPVCLVGQVNSRVLHRIVEQWNYLLIAEFG